MIRWLWVTAIVATVIWEAGAIGVALLAGLILLLLGSVKLAERLK